MVIPWENLDNLSLISFILYRKNKGDGKMDNSNLIYAYKKRSNDQIVYIGQTVNLKTRHLQHIKYDPYNKNKKEYNYPLSRGIRKYGEEEYELIILESNLKKDELDEREKYWINKYNTYWNGYNQTLGGNSFSSKPIFTEEKIDQVISMLQQEEYSYKDIISKTGISMTHIYNINNGIRRRKNDIKYPIRTKNTKHTKGLKFSPKENQEIHELISKSDLSFIEISKKYNCIPETIQAINNGDTQNYKLPNYSYPLRPFEQTKIMRTTKLTKQQIIQIHDLLKNSQLSIKEIAKNFQVNRTVITNINLGRTQYYILPDYIYPIRQGLKITAEQNLEIHNLLQKNKISKAQIGKMFNLSDSMINQINKGAVKSYHLPNWTYPIR